MDHIEKKEEQKPKPTIIQPDDIRVAIDDLLAGTFKIREDREDG